MSDKPEEVIEVSSAQTASFADLGLPAALLDTVRELGYEQPSPIQAATIPALLEGRDLLGQAQTGTGKTAAFALPILAGLQTDGPTPAVLVLAPTRELAIQVAEAFHRYAQRMPGFHVLPIYGGQAYGPQLAGLRRGVQVVVGTPGRVIDHLERGTLDLSRLSTLVLDEADEMLRMGFIDDVERVLERLPANCQIALFSATMPPPIRRIAQRYLKDPREVTIRSSTTTASTIRQRYWLVSGLHKLDALTRILEVEPFEAMIVFARTRIATEELANRLNARGFAAAALNGDVPQQQREQWVERLKSGEVDILVATDVAARGLDVERVTHVVNYDIPYDTEAYVHRIGRTGRAGRAGEAILFVAPRERGMLRAIEKATRQPIEPMGLPSVAEVNAQRLVRFKAAIAQVLEQEELAPFRQVVEEFQAEHAVDPLDIAAALARLLRGGDDLLLSEQAEVPVRADTRGEDRRREGRTGAGRPERGRPERGDRGTSRPSDEHLAPYRIEVGHVHGVRPGNIVGAIANEAGLAHGQVGKVRIFPNFSVVDLPAQLDAGVLDHLAGVRVAGQALRIRPDQGPGGGRRDEREARPSRPRREAGERDSPVRSQPERRGKVQSASPERKPRKTGPGSASTDRAGDRPPSRPAKPSRAQQKAGHRPRGKPVKRGS